MFQFCFHTRNYKTRYRMLIKHILHAIARCAWINMRRLFLYVFEMGLQMASYIVQRPNLPTLGLWLQKALLRYFENFLSYVRQS